MIKNYLFFLIVLFLYNCSDSKHQDKAVNKKENFVYLEKNQFKINGNDFFPIMLNYCICIRNVDSQYVASPLKGFGLPFRYDSFSKDSIHKTIETHFKIIKNMGFNSIRLVGPGRFKQQNNKLYLQVFTPKTTKLVPLDEHYDSYLNSIKSVVEMAKQQNLKILFLVGDEYVGAEDEMTYIKKLLTFFKDEPTIFAYDFFNEPLYFDKVKEREKTNALDLVNKWKKLRNKYAPYQLITIGFSEPIEVFEWDAQILPVDFMAFHVYNPLRIPNEIYWYSHYINKPWIIGETGLAADNDSVPYERQSAFIKQTFQYALNCGASGFALWQFQDVRWGMWRQNNKGLLTNEGTLTIDEFTIHGSLKPAASIIKELKDMKPDTNECNCPGNYFNMRDYHKFLITGKIVSESTGKPIEGAVIRGWTNDWRWGTNSFSDSTGTFRLYSQWEFVHFRISAPGYDRIKFDFSEKYKLTEAGKHPELYPDSMQRRIKHLTGNKFYNYQPEDFYYAFKKADMGTLKLPNL
ncbi:MAG TPA: carboxypeptidase regulatory-like domain-containing protein [Bacteroidales bacterium]|nr:carboxypeptidase regulatory-like domain-containing protein [Bacteroidales bacterium]